MVQTHSAMNRSIIWLHKTVPPEWFLSSLECSQIICCIWTRSPFNSSKKLVFSLLFLKLLFILIQLEYTSLHINLIKIKCLCTIPFISLRALRTWFLTIYIKSSMSFFKFRIKEIRIFKIIHIFIYTFLSLRNKLFLTSFFWIFLFLTKR